MGLFGERCERCDKKRTKKEFEGVPTCDACRLAIQADREFPRNCPIDRTQMNKEVVMNVILDRCPSCHGVWLDGGELALLKRAVTDESIATGMVIGIAAG